MRLFPFDPDYLERLCQGDREIQRHFAEYFTELLDIKLRARLRSKMAREDVRQETMARVLAYLRSQGGIQHPESLGAFVRNSKSACGCDRGRPDSRAQAGCRDTAP